MTLQQADCPKCGQRITVEMLGVEKTYTHIFHGWLIRFNNGLLPPTFQNEWTNKKTGKRDRTVRFNSPAEAMDWWDTEVGEQVKLMETPLGAYRVYTLKENTDGKDSRK
jgi:hypothetical protein